MYFDNVFGLVRVVLVGAPAYVALILLLRISGKRTLSKMNAFDLVVTVAIGSTFATLILSEDVALAEGVTAFALLVGLQFAVTWLSVRSETVARMVKAEPSLLYHRGEFLERALRRERVNRSELMQAMRDGGYASEQDVESVVLETDGSFSVLSGTAESGSSTLEAASRKDEAA